MIGESAPSGRAESERAVIAVRGGVVLRRSDRLAGEDPLEIRAAGPGESPVSVAVTMRTPGDDEDLASGFLITEGLIRPEDVAGFDVGDPARLAYPDNVLTVHLRCPFDAARIGARNFVATASCGICGKASIEDVERRCAPPAAGPPVEPEVLHGLPASLRAAQAVFERTGGLHACGLFDVGGRMLLAAEDVGRHNALDKLVGAARREERLPLAGRIVFVSGRASFEIVQKTAMAGAGLLAAVSAPTDLAVRASERLGVTLVAFLRGDGFNVYSHPERVAGLA